MAMHYEALDVSGDAGIRATGKTLKEAFAAAAIGMYSLITDLDSVQETGSIEVQVEGQSPEGLLIGFLNELVFQFDAYGFIGKGVEIKELEINETELETGKKEAGGRFFLKVKVYGEEFDPERHPRGLLIKAATYHGLEIEKKDGLWSLDVIFDI